ncbi:MAG: hypothetical protein ABRQ24_00075 [Syntrophomonadaceae bacterium]
MRKVLVLLLTVVLTLSVSMSAFAASDKGNNGKGKGANKSETQTTAVADSKALQKQFKQEMNQYVKDPLGALQGDLDALNASKTTLQSEIDDLTLTLAALDPASQEYADALADKDAKVLIMTDLDSQIAKVNTQLTTDPESLKKQYINERFMVIKSDKSGFDLSLFDNAQALIAAMYTAAQEPDAWSLWTNKSGNLIKLEGPMYLKGGKIMFPVKALENMGATVTPDLVNKTVTVTGANGLAIVFSYNGTTASAQASTELGTSTPLTFVFDDPAATSGPATIDGTIPCTVTNPLTGEPVTVELTIDAASDNISTDPVLLTTDGAISGTISGDIIDPVTSEVLGTVTGTVGGTLLAPEFALDSDTTAFAVPFESEITCGRAYVPLQELAQVFALEVAADTAEGTVTVEPSDPAAETSGSTETI